MAMMGRSIWIVLVVAAPVRMFIERITLLEGVTG
jgi:hypothetical protein